VEKTFDHIGIAVVEIESALESFGFLFGKSPEPEIEILESQQIKVAFIQLGGIDFELLEPAGPDSVLHSFLEKRGPGIHHTAWKVKDIDQTFKELEAKGLRVLSSAPYQGARNKRVFFIHPRDAEGVLVEFCSSSVDN